MIKVIQIFKSIFSIEKGSYNSEKRQEINLWPNQLESKTGYVKNNELTLADHHADNPDLKKTKLIVIQDIIGYDPHQFDTLIRSSSLPEPYISRLREREKTEFLQLFCIPTQSIKTNFELFTINTSGTHTSFDLNYNSNKDSIGVPLRDSHKIFDLKSDRAIEYRINGKIDHHSQRTFNEFKYIIQDLGYVSDINFESNNKIENVKLIPKDRKFIDERKILL